MLEQPNPVPVRTIAVTIGMVLATLIALYIVRALARIEALLLIAAFLATGMTPAVDLFQRRLHLRKALATLLVYIILFSATVGMLYLFIHPLVDEVRQLSDALPTYVHSAGAGRGPVGKLVKKHKLDTWVERNREKIQEGLS